SARARPHRSETARASPAPPRSSRSAASGRRRAVLFGEPVHAEEMPCAAGGQMMAARALARLALHRLGDLGDGLADLAGGLRVERLELLAHLEARGLQELEEALAWNVVAAADAECEPAVVARVAHHALVALERELRARCCARRAAPRGDCRAR